MTSHSEEEFKLIPIFGKDATGSSQIIEYAIVDPEDFDRLIKCKWFLDKSGYAKTRNREKGENCLMHRIILNLKVGDGIVTDHINRNRLDDRKKNLRQCTPQENARNRKVLNNKTSKYKGVVFIKSLKKWQCTITIISDGSKLNGGFFKDERLAGLRYDQLAREHHGEFAVLNFPEIVDYYEIDKYIEKLKEQKTSKYIGVYFSKKIERWVPRVNINYKTISSGSFNDEIEAAKIRDKILYRHRHLLKRKPIYNFPEEILND